MATEKQPNKINNCVIILFNNIKLRIFVTYFYLAISKHSKPYSQLQQKYNTNLDYIKLLKWGRVNAPYQRALFYGLILGLNHLPKGSMEHYLTDS